MKSAEGAGFTGLKALGWLMKRLRHLAGKKCVVKLKRAHGRFSGQIERFLDLAFLVVRREEAQVTDCWCPDEVVKKS